jgi:hypothetical protein
VSQCATLGPRFEIALSSSIQSEPVTGRVILVISRVSSPEVRLQAGTVTSPPMFGIDVHNWKPSQKVTIDSATLGYPAVSLRDIPAGDYFVQALAIAYTQYRRADGHVVWALDQWDGAQGLTQAPGNLYSLVEKIHFEPEAEKNFTLTLTQRVGPVSRSPDTALLKHVRIQSKLLSAFWGKPIYLGADILLPSGYEAHPDLKYPILYDPRNHYVREPAFGFSTQKATETDIDKRKREALGYETGFDFYKAWTSDGFPRVIVATLIEPTPYFDFSSSMNSDNNGPYDDAVMQELIPYIENHFRTVRSSYARVLIGKSSGGRDALGLQLHHPTFFGGAWMFYPWGFNYSNYFGLNIYQSKNAFFVDWTETQGFWNQTQWSPLQRYFVRTTDGKPVYTWRDWVRAEAVIGGASGVGAEFTGSDDALNSPMGSDGYPMHLYSKVTGKIDHGVAEYWRQHDLAYYAQANWQTIGPSLVGKLHFYIGDMDEWHRNFALYDFEEFLKTTTNPYFGGSFVYGSMRGHGWQPMSNAELVKMVAQQIEKGAP